MRLIKNVDKTKIIEWLTIQVEAGEKLFEYEENGKKDSTKLAEYFFSQSTYRLVLQKVQEGLFDEEDTK